MTDSLPATLAVRPRSAERHAATAVTRGMPIQALPYLATVLLLAGFDGRAVAPKAIGQPYVKER